MKTDHVLLFLICLVMLSCEAFLRWFSAQIEIVNYVKRILALSSHFHLSVFLSQSRHPTFSPRHDLLDQTNQIFPESLWHLLSADLSTTNSSPFLVTCVWQNVQGLIIGWILVPVTPRRPEAKRGPTNNIHDIFKKHSVELGVFCLNIWMMLLVQIFCRNIVGKCRLRFK